MYEPYAVLVRTCLRDKDTRAVHVAPGPITARAAGGLGLTPQEGTEMINKRSLARRALGLTKALAGEPGAIRGRRLGKTALKSALVLAAFGTGALSVAPAASARTVAQLDNSSVIAAAGTDGGVNFFRQTVGTALWHPEQVAPTGTTSLTPAVAQVGSSSVVTVAGPRNSLDFFWQAIGTTPWHEEQVAGPGTTFSTPSVAQVGRSSVITAEGPAHSLDFYWQTIGTTPVAPRASGPKQQRGFRAVGCSSGELDRHCQRRP